MAVNHDGVDLGEVMERPLETPLQRPGTLIGGKIVRIFGKVTSIEDADERASRRPDGVELGEYEIKPPCQVRKDVNEGRFTEELPRAPDSLTIARVEAGQPR